MKIKTIVVSAIAGCLALPALAQGHVFVEPAEGPADGFVIADFIVPHGCDGSPTTEISVQIPENVPLVTAQRNAFWDLETKEGPKDEVELFGETITEGVSEITWTAREPLPDDQLDKLGAEISIPGTVGETVYFPVVQKCEKGETRWIEIPKEGETEEDLESPAPAIEVTAAEEDHHGDEEEAGEEAEEAGEEAEEAVAEAGEAVEEADDGGSSDGLAIAGLIVGALGLITGGTALARSRRNG